MNERTSGRPSVDHPFSDIDLSRWKQYEEVITGTLWLLGARDNSGQHNGDYWGNFVPQIVTQVLQRFTKRGEVVIDLFSGMGTTPIECRRMGRHCIGIDLNPDVVQSSRERVEAEDNPHDVTTKVVVSDSSSPAAKYAVLSELRKMGVDFADCCFLHPPYHDIIKFSEHENDLSNAATLEEFLERFRTAATTALAMLRPGRFMALVIGDKYANGELVPLGFECMRVCREVGFQLRAINVKDIQGNQRGKGKNENLWKYRALREGFYVFKHEYVMIFRRPDR